MLIICFVPKCMNECCPIVEESMNIFISNDLILEMNPICHIVYEVQADGVW